MIQLLMFLCVNNYSCSISNINFNLIWYFNNCHKFQQLNPLPVFSLIISVLLLTLILDLHKFTLKITLRFSCFMIYYPKYSHLLYPENSLQFTLKQITMYCLNYQTCISNKSINSFYESIL